MLQENRKNCIKILMGMCPNIKRENLEKQYTDWTLHSQVETVEIEKGITIQLFHDAEKNWQLNSSCNPSLAATLWAQQYDVPEINDQAMFFVFGMGDGRALLELAQRKKMCRILVYEPSADIFWEAIGRDEWVSLLELSNIYLFVEGINEEYFFHTLQEFLDYSNIQLVQLGVLPNYERIFGQSYVKFRQIIESAMELVFYTRNTELQRMEEISENMYALSGDMIKQYSVRQLFGCVERMGWQQVPAILIAAGPSLDSSLNELQRFRGKAFFMAVDTALNTILENDIVPDMIISVDSRKPLKLFDNLRVHDIPIALSQQSNREVVKLNQSLHFYEVDEEAYLNKIFMEETGKGGVQLPTGGSVANNALSLLIHMGFQTIILVGQDLAYPNLQQHTKSAYKDENNTIRPEQEGYELVEDVQGGQIYTQKNMNIYRKWMEQYIAGYKDVNVINVSKQGARIAGTKETSLEEWLIQCENVTIEAEKLWDTIQPYFSEAEQTKLQKRLCQIPERVDKLEYMTDMGMQLYQNMEKLYGENEYAKIRDNLEKAVKLTSQIESIAETVLIRPYMIEQQYAIEDRIYQYSETDSIEKQIWDMICNGKELMSAYQIGICKFREKMYLIVPENENAGNGGRQKLTK